MVWGRPGWGRGRSTLSREWREDPERRETQVDRIWLEVVTLDRRGYGSTGREQEMLVRWEMIDGGVGVICGAGESFERRDCVS